VLTLPTGVTNGDALLNLNELFNTLEF
jgi:hypothetical protein